jgi:hypothetical protein
MVTSAEADEELDVELDDVELDVVVPPPLTV